MTILENKSLKALNTFGIDVQAYRFAEYGSVEELDEILSERKISEKQTNRKLPVLHIGGGSNLLFLQDYEGLVLHNTITSVEVVAESADDVVVRVGGGMVFDDLIALSLQKGWFGLENLSIIPGEVGASAVQNIGAYGVEAKDFITLIELVNLQTGAKQTMTNREANYSYRYSALKSSELWGQYAVTYVHFHLKKTFVPRLEYGGIRSAYESLISIESSDDIELATKLRQVIIEMRNGKLPDPKVLGNAGSFFMNPIIPRDKYVELLCDYPSMPHYDVDDERVKVPAGWLIEQTGWKGKKLGNAGVYEKQALVLVNLGGAEGKDIVALSEAVRKDVKTKFGIDIHPEVNFI